MIFFFMAIAIAFNLDKAGDIFSNLETKPNTLQLNFEAQGFKNLCITSRFRQKPVANSVEIDGSTIIGTFGENLWTISGAVCNLATEDFIFSVTRSTISGHITLNKVEFILETNSNVLKEKEKLSDPDQEDSATKAAEMQMLQATQFEISRVVAGATLNPGQVTIFLHVDIDDTLSTRLIPTGQNLAAGRQAAMQYMIQLIGWITENIYYENGYSLQVSGVNFRSTPLSPQLSSLQYIYAMEALPRKSNAHLVYHATAARLGGGIASLRGLYSNGARGNGLCGNMRGDWSVWDRMCTAHEIGHNIGGPHSHDVGIDECGKTCVQQGAQNQIPIYNTAVKYGTVMSYCHLCSGGLRYDNNIKFEFHPEMIVKQLHAAYAAYQSRMNPVSPGTKPLVDGGVGIPGSTGTTKAPATTPKPATTKKATSLPEATTKKASTQAPGGSAEYTTVRQSQAIGGGKCGHVVYGDNMGNGACQQGVHSRMWMCGGLANCAASGIVDIATCAARVKQTADCSSTFDTFNPSTVARYGFRRCSCLLKIGGALQPQNLVYADIHLLKTSTQPPTATQPPAANKYTKVTRGCVIGNNIQKYSGKTVAECTAICDASTACLAFEFGVDYNGESTLYKAGDCQPQSSANLVNCDGGRFNLDLYVKNSNAGGGNVATVDACQNVVCQNGGTCSGGACTCANGFSGNRCQTNAAPHAACKTTTGKTCLPFFKFQGKIYAGCTTEGSPNGKAWCAVNQAGESLEWGECNMGAPVKIGSQSSTGCRVVPAANTPAPWTTEFAFERGKNIANGAWLQCSQTTGTKEWAQTSCSKDPQCAFLHDTDCDANSYRYCSGALSEQVVGDAKACTYIKAVPLLTICADEYELEFCQAVVETDACNTYGKKCQASCGYCRQKMVGEDGTLNPVIQDGVDAESSAAFFGILTALVFTLLSLF